MSDIVVFSTTQRILVDPLAPFRIATSRLQRIIVNPSTSSVSVINAGPMGPRGLTGATGPSEAAIILTVDGDILTRAAGVLAPITRSNLATDLAGNAGFTSKYARVINHAAVAGTARGGTGAILWIGSVNPTNATNDDELFRTDTVVLSKRIDGVWVVVSGSIFVGNSAPASPTDGKLWWDTDDVAIVPPLSAATLAADSAFTSRYMQVVNHGATAGTARTGTGPIHWIGSVNPTNAIDNDALYRTDQTAFYKRVTGAWVEIGSTRFVTVPTAWTAISTLANSWVSYGAGYAPQYRKIGDNVQLRGLMKDGTTGTVFTLPVGFRPAYEETFVVFGTNAFGGLSVNPSGVVSIQAPTVTGAGKFIYLSNIIFSTVA